MNTGLALVLLLTGIPSTQSSVAHRDWELVLSAPNEFGGTMDFVLIPEAKQRNRDYYTRVAEAVCGVKTKCMVLFWTDRKHIRQPKPGGWIAVEDWAVVTAEYERHPNYKQPVLSLACWLYPNKAAGEADKCVYNPGAKRPPDK